MKRLAPLSAVILPALLLACSDSSTGPEGFAEFAWLGRTPDVRTERLCAEAADPDRAPDTTFIDCRIEGDTFAERPPPAKDELVVVAWNILRGFEALGQIELLKSRAFAPEPDVILLSEADRGCERSDFLDVTREYARAFGFYYVYATEFIELPDERGFEGPYDPPLCEHGNSIVSRYPLGNVRALRHAANRSWYTPPGFPEPDEPRLGGRVVTIADMAVGDRLVRLHVLHLESRVDTLHIRDAQAEEIAIEAFASPHPVIVGGDFNAYGALSDLQTGATNDNPTQSFRRRGFVDPHDRLDPDGRGTGESGLAIDFLFVRDLEVVDAGLCPRELCGSLSDHLPVWSVLALPAP
jgi:endonuclease/exonuclease/phosphatase family metal-dependent hydrolase